MVSFGRFPYSQGRLTKEDEEKIDEAITFLGLKEIENSYIDELSGGQKQRAFLAMVVAQDTEYILLDEPLNNLDMKHSVQIMRTLKKLCNEKGKTIIIVIHEINFAANYSDYIVAMKDGKIRHFNTTKNIITPEVLKDIFDINFEINLFAITMFLSFASCKTDKNKDTATAETAETISVTHPLGTAKIVQTPQRVVVLDFAVVETLDELGIKIIGMPKENIPDYLQKYRDDSSITNLGTLKEIDYEKLNELNPDVIFMSGRLQNVYPELNKIAPTVYTEIDYTDYMNSIEENFGIIGEVFGRKDAIDNALNTLKEKIAAVHKQMNDSDQKALVVLHNKIMHEFEV